jgi:hypothetical protein
MECWRSERADFLGREILETDSPGRMEQEFWDFHVLNPLVYELFDKFARTAARSRPRYSARSIWHRMRWERDFATTDEEYKLNDHHSPYYSRLWLINNPENVHLFVVQVTNVPCFMDFVVAAIRKERDASPSDEEVGSGTGAVLRPAVP